MGTNYYLYEKPACTECGRPYERRHIGKSSGGWCFSLHVENCIRDIDDWELLWSASGAYIEDEYGTRVSVEDMRTVIMARARPDDHWGKSPMGYASWTDFHAMNHSERGPAGLLRHQVGRYCLGHGLGTWDLIPGEFG